MISIVESDEINFKHIWFSYEHIIRPLHPCRFTVWRAIFVEDNTGIIFITKNVTSQVYVAMLNSAVISYLYGMGKINDK